MVAFLGTTDLGQEDRTKACKMGFARRVQMVGDGAFLVGRRDAPPWSLGVEEEDYQNYGTISSFRQLISNDL
jgi:hypothetical protein